MGRPRKEAQLGQREFCQIRTHEKMEEKSSRKVVTLKEIPLEYKGIFLELAKSAWILK